MNIAVFGSAFNPPTRGHEDAIRNVLESAKIDKLLLVPSYKHAFAKQMLDYDLRLKMLALFVKDLASEQVEMLAIEHEIAQKDKPVFTFDLLSHLQNEMFIEHTISFVIGPDNKNNWDKFYKADEIQSKWPLLVVDERKPIRSTKVRERLASKKAISDLVTPSVEAFLEKHQAYV